LLLLMMILPAAGRNAAGDEKKQNNDKQKRISEETAGTLQKWLEEDVCTSSPREKTSLQVDHRRGRNSSSSSSGARDPDPRPTTTSIRKTVPADRLRQRDCPGIPGWKTDQGMVYIK
jgi:hypothetical protein